MYESRHDETFLRKFRPGPTQTGPYRHRRWVESLNFGFCKKRGGIIRVAKTKALISFAFVFAYAKSRFSHEAAQ